MSTRAPRAVTAIARHSADGVDVRGYDLAHDLVGRVGYTDMLGLLVCGRLPDERERAVLDACLVTLMEAGINASTVVARVTASARPGQSQAAIAAGLLTVGERFVGSSQACGELLEQATGLDSEGRLDHFRTVVRRHRREQRPVPGLGHGRHEGTDPRAQRLIELADELGVAQEHLARLRSLQTAACDVLGRDLLVNVTGAIAALLLGVGVPARALTAMAVVSRCGGLAAHVVEEPEVGTTDALWRIYDEAVGYEPATAGPPPAGTTRHHPARDTSPVAGGEKE